MTEHDILQVAENDPEAIETVARMEREIGFTMFPKAEIHKIIENKKLCKQPL